MDGRNVVLSGCSGGGKSTLLKELERRGFIVIPEPGRRIVEQELRSGGDALPWTNLAAFATRAIEMAGDDQKSVMSETDWVFFDRGLVDAADDLGYETVVLPKVGVSERADFVLHYLR